MSFDFNRTEIRQHMNGGGFGLEKESLRVDTCGYLSHTSHPFAGNPNIDRDFCESQTELITDVCASADSAYDHLVSLHRTAVRTLLRLESGKELLWPFSNPPYVKEEDISIASYEGELKGKEKYREYLAGKYGKKKMLFSGIHFNFSFPEELLRAGYEQEGGSSYQEYKNNIYLELAKKVTRYSWLVVFLTAASPVMDGSFFQDSARGKDVLKKYASSRCSEIGYWNDFIPLLDYTSLESYIRSIQDYVDDGQLKAATELYYPVRLKPAGENSLEGLQVSGVNHIELRMLDLNPLSPVGLKREDVQFLHLLLLYLMSLEDREFETFEQIMAIKNMKRAAEYDSKGIRIELGWNRTASVQDAAEEVLAHMEDFSLSMGREDFLETVEYQREKLRVPGKRYAERIREAFGQEYVVQGLKLAEKNAEEIVKEQENV